MFETIGIIGYGAFGRVLHSRLDDLGSSILVADAKPIKDLPSSVKMVDIVELANSSDLIVIAVPFMSYNDVLSKIREHIKPGAVVMDVCSVKKLPLEKLQSDLPKGTELLVTHPLFGPESVESNQIVICSESTELAMSKFQHLCRELDWHVIIMSADEHDRQMALVHGLTFFVAETLLQLNIREPSIPTGFYGNLQRLMATQRKHSSDLTLTIEKYNPYVAKIRQKFLEKAEEIDQSFVS